MPPEKDWRAPSDEAGDDALQYSDIAIGYVSRNSRYRADYRRALDRVKRGVLNPDEATAGLVRRWGISFHATPAAAFDRKLAVARPDLAPDSIILGDLLYLILADEEGDEHVWVSGSLDEPMAMMLPIGSDPFARLAAAERLCRRMCGMASGPPALRPPPFRREHLLTLLQVLDGHHAGATQRELAASLIHRRVRRYNAAEWVESAERKRIKRWLKEAIELRDGGYLRLLRGG